MIKGSCLCGEVKYRYKGEITEVAICHCDQCKRAQGTPFVTNAPVDTDKFEWEQGSDLAKSYFSSPNKKRVFCANCGSPLFSQRTDMPGTVRLRMGSITEGKIPSPDYEIYCESEAHWYEDSEQRPRYDKNKV